MTKTLNGKALKIRRESQNLTQDQLGALLKPPVPISTISRWERGEQEPSNRKREQLARALKCDWDLLCREPEAKAADESWPFESKVQFNRRMTQQIVNAYHLVSVKYQVLDTDILELAPLLFTIFAERSLKWRNERLNEIWAAAARVEDVVGERLPHLAPLNPLSFEDQDMLTAEEKSIRERDIFGKHSSWNYASKPDVFENFLEDELKRLGGEQELVTEMSVNGYHCSYHLDAGFLASLTGLSLDDEAQRGMVERISEGDIDLRVARAKSKELSREEYLKWLSDRIAEKQAERSKKMSEFGLDLSLDSL